RASRQSLQLFIGKRFEYRDLGDLLGCPFSIFLSADGLFLFLDVQSTRRKCKVESLAVEYIPYAPADKCFGLVMLCVILAPLFPVPVDTAVREVTDPHALAHFL